MHDSRSRSDGAQVANGTYDRDANLALLRLYNFEPEMVHGQTLANVLLLALMRLPEVDFSLLLHLIPSSIQVTGGSVQTLMQLMCITHALLPLKLMPDGKRTCIHNYSIT